MSLMPHLSNLKKTMARKTAIITKRAKVPGAMSSGRFISYSFGNLIRNLRILPREGVISQLALLAYRVYEWREKMATVHDRMCR